MTHKYALAEPAIVAGAEDGQTLELARVWVHRGEPAIMVRAAYEDPHAMGQMLAELSWHFSHAYVQRGFTQLHALEALNKGWVEGQANGLAAQKAGAAR